MFHKKVQKIACRGCQLARSEMRERNKKELLDHEKHGRDADDVRSLVKPFSNSDAEGREGRITHT